MQKNVLRRVNNGAGLRKLARLLPALILAALMAVSCIHSPVPPSRSQDSSGQTAPGYSEEDALPDEDSGEPEEEPPYGEPVPPGAELLERLSQHFPVGDPKGWLTLPSTTINNAVMYNPDDNEYYLDQRISYAGKFDNVGVIFADYRNTLGSRRELSRNTILYGHNVELFGFFGQLFSQLLRYQDVKFATENQFISFSTAQDEMAWQVFAAFTTDTDFYYIEPNPTDDELMFIVSEACQRSDFFFDTEVSAGDKILTLSTCTYKYGLRKDQRFVVMAKLLPGTDAHEPVTVLVNENKKLPSFVK